MSIYDRFKDEKELRSAFLRPLMMRMGFLSITELDGSLEFGKDFVFAEVTPFGFERYYAIVAKHEKNIRQPATKLCETVLGQIRQAFSVPFTLGDTSGEHFVSTVIVANSGKISQNAKTWIRAELNKERYGENVHIFDGERLSHLDQHASFQRQELFLPRLSALEAN